MSPLTATIGREVIAAVLVAAAIGKGRTLSDFVDYLAIPFGRGAGAVARLVLGTEIVLGGLLAIAGRIPFAGFACLGFLLVSSAVYAARLSLSPDSRCNCFGHNTRMTESSWLRMTHPAWYALRNAAIGMVAWQATNRPDQWQGAVISGAAIVLIVVIGLVASVALERHRLRLPEHPLRAEFAPRLGDLIALTWYQDGEPRSTDALF